MGWAFITSFVGEAGFVIAPAGLNDRLSCLSKELSLEMGFTAFVGVSVGGRLNRF